MNQILNTVSSSTRHTAALSRNAARVPAQSLSRTELRRLVADMID